MALAVIKAVLVYLLYFARKPGIHSEEYVLKCYADRLHLFDLEFRHTLKRNLALHLFLLHI